VEDIKCIEGLFTGFFSHFFIDELRHRIDGRFQTNRTAQRLFAGKGLEHILADLFRLGAVGNDFVIADGIKKEKRNRWVFRGNTELFIEERMAIHRSLWKRFSLGIRKGIPRMGIFR
jgi:hypothetical protein